MACLDSHQSKWHKCAVNLDYNASHSLILFKELLIGIDTIQTYIYIFSVYTWLFHIWEASHPTVISSATCRMIMQFISCGWSAKSILSSAAGKVQNMSTCTAAREERAARHREWGRRGAHPIWMWLLSSLCTHAIAGYSWLHWIMGWDLCLPVVCVDAAKDGRKWAVGG